tara:strand:- start:1395 stop:2000 length:606 start_codon:yes stop_codon:yes gene_type:complete
MEEINKEIDNKSIERMKTEVSEVVLEQPKKKTRSEAQILAFEKAKAKRQANLKAKKEEKELDDWANEELEKEDPTPVIKAPPKKRGRPRKVKAIVREEPRPAEHWIPPPDPQLASGYGYPQQRPNTWNPWQNYQQPQPPPQPVNNYYYYGHPPEGQGETLQSPNPTNQPQPQSQPEPESEDEIEYEQFASYEQPKLKFRFA